MKLHPLTLGLLLTIPLLLLFPKPLADRRKS